MKRLLNILIILLAGSFFCLFFYFYYAVSGDFVSEKEYARMSKDLVEQSITSDQRQCFEQKLE
ncbi:hypothetical protein J2S01_002149 [Pectinatus haikarae]|uniref:Uncharacterized protein n=1 Tax=Pectinatus haikarae TaxID=349096 RepID=A0ABT9YA59_9FIRM|nr:hypothetical protein [Pectinatus haikarae]